MDGRTRLSALPFPTVSVLAIYSAAPLPPGPSTAPEAEHGKADKDDEQTVEMNKVVYWYSQQEELTVERKARLMGTIRGMADFARMLSTPGGEGIRSVHSLRQRMVWLEVDKGWTVHATIDLPRQPKHPRSPSAASATDSAPPPATLPLDDNALLAALAQAYAQYKLEHGSLQGKLAREGREKLVEGLRGWWNGFVVGWRLESGEPGALERTVGGLLQSPLRAATSVHLDPLITQFAATHSSAMPILLHRAQVLSLPTIPSPSPPPSLSDSTANPTESRDSPVPTPPSSRPARPPPPPITEADLAALVRYLADRVPPAPPSAATAAAATASPAVPALVNTASGAATPGSSKWYQFGLGGFDTPTLPRVPSVPLPTLPSMNVNMSMPALAMPSVTMPSVNMTMPSMNMTMPSLPSIPGLSGSPASEKTPGSPAKASGGGWGMRNVSWGTDWLKKGHKRSSSSLAKAAAAVPVEAAEAGAEVPVGEEVAEPTEEGKGGAIASDGQPVAVEVSSVPDQSPGGDEAALAPPDALASNSVTPGSSARSPATPAVKLADEVDPIALAEAMASMEALGKVEAEREGERSGEAAADGKEASEVVAAPRVVKEVGEVFVGGGEERDTRAEVWSFQHGELTLGLITRPTEDLEGCAWLESRSLRLLEAVQAVVDGASGPSRRYPHPHLIRAGALTTSHGFPSPSTGAHWSGKPSADEHDAAAALFEAYRQSSSRQPAVLESFVRLNSGQWVIRQKAEEVVGEGDAEREVETEVYLALPGKVGKEGSLVDAAEELRRMRRVAVGA